MKRVSLWLHGGIGTGDFSQGQPAIEKILQLLQADFDLVIYSRHPPNKEYQSAFQIRTAPDYISINTIRWFWLMGCFILDHFKKKYDILFSFWGYPSGFCAVILGKIFRRPSVIYLFGADTASVVSIDYGILLNPFHREIALWAYRHCDQLLALTEYQKDRLKDFGFERPIRIIPMGVDLNIFDFKPRPWSPVLNIIHVGHLSPVKDQKTLLKTFSQIVETQQARLKIFGGDDMHGELQRKTIELGIHNRVEFEGVVPYAEMPKHYNWAHMMIHTSLSEGQCAALTEAAACGVILAGTKVGLLYDLDDSHAIRVEVGDYKTLCEKIIEAALDPNAQDEKKRKARLWAEQHDIQWSVRELREVLRSIS